MPKNAYAEVLRRWMAADRALAGPEGLHVPTFARLHGVHEKTVRRDLATFGAFRRLRQLLDEAVEDEARRAGRRPSWPWHYAEGVGRLFRDEPPRSRPTQRPRQPLTDG
jgi:hypothetical protein